MKYRAEGGECVEEEFYRALELLFKEEVMRYGANVREYMVHVGPVYVEGRELRA